MGHTQATFFGDGLKVTGTTHAINIANGRNFSFDMDASQDVTMPDEDLFIHTGGIMFLLANHGANSFDVKYDDGTTAIGTLAALKVGRLWLSGEVGSRVWHMLTTTRIVPTTPGGDPPDPPTDVGPPTGGPGDDDPTDPTGPTDAGGFDLWDLS